RPRIRLRPRSSSRCRRKAAASYRQLPVRCPDYFRGSPMEASEKPQLPIDEASGEPAGVVRALDDRLVIERLTVSDERAARVVRERTEGGQEPTRTVADAIEIGTRGLDREDAAAEVDYVRAEFQRHAGQPRERLTRS